MELALPSTSPPPELRIRLRVSNYRAYLWDVQDIATLRDDYHICGILTGTLPHLAQQNVFLGLPLMLIPEEVVLLVEKKIAVLVDDASAHLSPTDAQLERHVQVMQEEITRQTSQTQARMISEAQGQGRANSEQAQRKRREREQKRAADAARRAGLAIEDVAHFSPGPPAASSTPTPIRPDTPSNLASNHIPYVVQIPASSTPLDWYKPTDSVYDELSAARDAGVWVYPSNESQRARCDVFRDLWELGYFMGGGIKFGGDWLVYPGDPLRYHSHFVAQTLQESDQLRPMEIVAHGRLGTATKKAHLLCAVNPLQEDPNVPNIEYFSVEWAGFG